MGYAPFFLNNGWMPQYMIWNATDTIHTSLAMKIIFLAQFPTMTVLHKKCPKLTKPADGQAISTIPLQEHYSLFTFPEEFC